MPFSQCALRRFRIKRHGGIADVSQDLHHLRQANLIIIPAKFEPFGSQIHLSINNARLTFQRFFNQPDTGSTVNPLDQQLNRALRPERVDIVRLHFIQIIGIEFFRYRRWWRQRITAKRLTVETLKT